MKTLSKLSQRSFVESWSICNVGSWVSKVLRPSMPRLRHLSETAIQMLSNFFPRPIATQESRCFDLSAFVAPRIFELLVANFAISFFWAVLFTSSSQIDSGGKVTLFGDASRSTLIVMPSFAGIDNFKMIFHRSISMGVLMLVVPKGVLSKEELRLYMLTAPFDT